MSPVSTRQAALDAAVRERSEALFGQACKLEVLAAIAEVGGRAFTLSDLVRAPQYRSRYHKVLADLCGAELLDRLPKRGRDVPYVRVSSTLWQWAQEYVASISERVATADGGQLPSSGGTP
ncbi:hypothetical protein [Mycobacteroides chelonae]|uniref:hypothetical protein n=1 Tax=Mycobacteroides chelonae TaxID=1774 RepID=UPI001C2BBCBB|nr:hypothetical protein [Mycobacteroides chelonae]MBV0919759.1 hypothetical protein [Mycobacteroides chelonae]